MPIYSCKKTGRLFVQFDHKGKTYKRRLPEGTSRDDARKMEVKMRSDVFFGHNGLDGKPDALWEDFVQEYYLEYVEANHPPEALDRALVIVKASMPLLKGKTVRQIKPADLERFKASRMQTPTRHGKTRKPATIHREMKILSAAFSMAVRNDFADSNPMAKVKLPSFDNIQDKTLHPDDEEKFLMGFRNTLQREIALTVLYTGLRQNDVLGLRKQNIDLRRDEIKLVQGKTKRRVAIPIHDRIRGMLTRRMESSCNLIFPSYRKPGKQMGSIKHAIKFACERAGIPVLTIRDLRRTYGTRLHEDGTDDTTTAALLGHSDTRCVHRYKRGSEIKRKAIQRLGKSEEPTSIPASVLIEQLLNDPNLLKELVEMRRIELLASALRTQPPEAVTVSAAVN
jgi:integrase